MARIGRVHWFVGDSCIAAPEAVAQRHIQLYASEDGCKCLRMTQTVEVPLWLFVLILLFAAVTFASHFLFPSVRWYLRRRLEKAVSRLNTRLARPIEPFKLARRQDMIQRLLYDPEVSEAIVAHARAQGVREDVAFEQARRYAREIVPSFSAFAYFGFGTRAARWLANMLYDVRTGAGNDEALKAIPPDATVVFIMNHRSNMDYVLVTYLAAGASALSYAVGEWARVWPLSRLIRSMGAYFIRRRSRGALYRKVLARYVQMATEGGVTQAIFPEGGLSVDGGLMPPKLGLLNYVVSVWRPDGRDVAFVPVSINYDRVLEDRVLVAAGQRGDRRFGAKISVVAGFIAQKVWLRITGRFLRFGQAGVVFGQPILLSTHPARTAPETLAMDLMGTIGRHMPVLAVPLACHLVLRNPQGLTRDEMRAAGEAAVAHAQSRAPEGFAGSVDQMLGRAVPQLLARGVFVESDQQIRPGQGAEPILKYYANSISAHFDGE